MSEQHDDNEAVLKVEDIDIRPFLSPAALKMFEFRIGRTETIEWDEPIGVYGDEYVRRISVMIPVSIISAEKQVTAADVQKLAKKVELLVENEGAIYGHLWTGAVKMPEFESLRKHELEMQQFLPNWPLTERLPWHDRHLLCAFVYVDGTVVDSHAEPVNRNLPWYYDALKVAAP